MARRGVRMRDLLDAQRFRELVERNVDEVRRLAVARAASPSPASTRSPTSTWATPTSCAATSATLAPRARRDQARPARAVRGRAGRAARRRSRHLSVRHLVVDARGGRVHRGGHRPDGDHQRHRHRQGVHDARRRRAVPDRARPTRSAIGCAKRAASTARPPAGRVAAAGSTCRRCGWRCAGTACRALALTKLDVLRGMRQRSSLRRLQGRRQGARRAADRSRARSSRAEPVYEELEGWDADTARGSRLRRAAAGRAEIRAPHRGARRRRLRAHLGGTGPRGDDRHPKSVPLGQGPVSRVVVQT